MKKQFLFLMRLAAIGGCLLAADVALAQPGGGGPVPDDPNNPGGATDVPIDGGVSLLVAAGIGMGIKRLRRKKTAV